MPDGIGKDIPTIDDLTNFDWDSSRFTGQMPVPEAPYLMFQAPVKETHFERCGRMLTQLRRTCMACTMCELGRKGASKDGHLFLDPHVLSNQNPKRFMVVGQNPGWEELRLCEPFVGQAGANFDQEIAKYGLSRTDFYICNVVRCWTKDNAKPEPQHVARCRPFLQMEVNLIRPLLVITLGALAFDHFCPGTSYDQGLGDVTFSTQYDVPVFAVFHPSPLNLSDRARAKQFKSQVKIMCGLVKELQRGA